MEKRLKNYIALMDGINLADRTEKERNAFRMDLLVQIGFFQQERLAHLIVTGIFAVLTMLSILGCLTWPGISFLLSTGLLILLLILYIRHYYILENGVQKLYKYYDKVIR